MSGVTVKPHAPIIAAALAASVPIKPLGLFMAK